MPFSLSRDTRLGAFVLLILMMTGAATAAADTRGGASGVDLQVGRHTGPEKLVYGFFHPTTGERVARLQIERVNLEYGKHGVFRVAWKARAVLRNVELRIDDETAFPAAIEQLAQTLRSLEGAEGLILRDVSILRPGEAPRIEAAVGEFTRTGELLLPAARLSDGAAVSVRLPLRGPQAGTLQFSHPLSPASTSSRDAP